MAVIRLPFIARLFFGSFNVVVAQWRGFNGVEKVRPKFIETVLMKSIKNRWERVRRAALGEAQNYEVSRKVPDEVRIQKGSINSWPQRLHNVWSSYRRLMGLCVELRSLHREILTKNSLKTSTLLKSAGRKARILKTLCILKFLRFSICWIDNLTMHRTLSDFPVG